MASDDATSLTGEQYRAGLDMLAQAYRIIQLVPLSAMREFHIRAETLGPLLDPTAYHWRGGADNLADQGDMLRAAQQVIDQLDSIRRRVERRQAPSR